MPRQPNRPEELNFGRQPVDSNLQIGVRQEEQTQPDAQQERCIRRGRRIDHRVVLDPLPEKYRASLFCRSTGRPSLMSGMKRQVCGVALLHEPVLSKAKSASIRHHPRLP
jgi:hypothetical protein